VTANKAEKSARAELAEGSSVDYVQFNLNFAGARTSPLSFTFEALLGNQIVDSSTITWDGNSWSVDHPDAAPIVPEASSLALLLPGLLPVAYFLRRRKA
jgi:hypothetical protein